MQEKKVEKEFLTPREVSRIFGIAEQTLANLRWLRLGPPYFKPSRRKVLYRRSDVEKWIEQFKIRTFNFPGADGADERRDRGSHEDSAPEVKGPKTFDFAK